LIQIHFGEVVDLVVNLVPKLTFGISGLITYVIPILANRSEIVKVALAPESLVVVMKKDIQEATPINTNGKINLAT
jgi:hypothetical protein